MGEPAPSIEVRPYRDQDRASVFGIMADTAFFGDPVEAFLEDRNLFCEAFCAYYTDVEPGFSWVASADGEVVGALLGCANTRRQRKRWPRRILPNLLKHLVTGRYRLGPLTWRYTCNLARSILGDERPKVDLDLYPAHLHINLQAGWRGYGYGRRLIQAYLRQLKQSGVPGVHLATTNLNRAACHLYTALGFNLIDKRQTRAWKGFVAGPVENRVYGLLFI